MGTRSLILLGWLALLSACGGGSGDSTAPNQAPTARIVSPPPGALFSAGQSLTVTVEGQDVEDGALPASRLTWWVELHHDSHTHPAQPATVGFGANVAIPVRGETSDNIFYRLHLRATDSAGLSTEVTRDIQPRKAQVTLSTQPAGLALTLDGQPFTAGQTFTGVVGTERESAGPGQRQRRLCLWPCQRQPSGPAGCKRRRLAGVDPKWHRALQFALNVCLERSP